ncbi:MAG: macro domain-containing protein [Oscillospiraceae bacterium]|nr:macro domain-containing protein [Oscillospiraceae bacterium]
MPYTVTQQDILTIGADAAVISIENPMSVADGPVNEALAAAGGEALRQTLREKRFLPVGRACASAPCGLPFRHLLVTAAPRWWNGEANELTVLHRCYAGLFELAERLGCRTIATAFLSANYYQFPKAEAVAVACREAERASVDTIFVAESAELAALAGKSYRRPQIVAYLGWHRDHAAFLLDNGQYAKVDMRPEKRDVSVHPFLEPCYFDGRTAPPVPLPEEEKARLRRIYETAEI